MDDLLHFSRVVLPTVVPRFDVSSAAVERGLHGREGESASSDNTRVPAVDTAAPGSGGRSTRGHWEGDNQATAAAGEDKGAAEGSGVGGSGGSGGDKESGEHAAAGSRLDISVVAHSMGGLTAVYAAVEDPLLFKRVRRDSIGLNDGMHTSWEVLGEIHGAYTSAIEPYSVCILLTVLSFRVYVSFFSCPVCFLLLGVLITFGECLRVIKVGAHAMYIHHTHCRMPNEIITYRSVRLFIY